MGSAARGYSWWIRELAGYPAYHAWGYGGQFIFVVPQLGLVEVITSDSNVNDAGKTRRRSLHTAYDLVESYVIPPIAAMNR